MILSLIKIIKINHNQGEFFMMTKNILFLFILLHAHGLQSNPLATQLMLNRKKQCTGKIAKQRQPLFIQVEEYEEHFIRTKSKCLEAGNCDSDEDYAQAKDLLKLSITTLNNHLEQLEEKTDGACHVCEKNEAKNIKKRLVELLDNVSST